MGDADRGPGRQGIRDSWAQVTDPPRATDPAGRPAVERVQGERAWSLVRAALLVAWLVLLVGAVLLGGRTATLSDLLAAVETGRVDEVTLVGGLEPGVTGQAQQEARWRDGLVLRVAEYEVVRGDDGFVEDVPTWSTTDDGVPLERTSEDVAQRLVALDPDIEVRTEPWPGAWTEVLGWRFPSWVGLLLVPVWLGPLLLLVGGPQPWRATRWAWFWLLQPPVGTVAFLLLSGPLPGGRRTAPPGARLTGGWAFLLSLVIGSLLGPTLWGMR